VSPRTGVIIGAGPAGLTAAYEMLDKTDIRPVVLEATDAIGGIARTARYKGNRIDIGGHRFFSKSSVVMDWWFNVMPLQGAPSRDDRQLGRRIPLAERATQREIGAEAPRTFPAPDPEETDVVMLRRGRLSRIYFLRRFFHYPITLSLETLRLLGPVRTVRIGVSYAWAMMFQIRPERSLEDFFVNRFGRALYETFFRDYTEKVWGVKCSEIKPEWGAQRIKGLSIVTALKHALQAQRHKDGDVRQARVETSLIEQFTYPKLGPGQMWEHVADLVRERGCAIHMRRRVVRVHWEPGRVTSVVTRDEHGEETTHEGDFFVSSMPIKDLVEAMVPRPPDNVYEVATNLQYRDFITVGLLLRRLAIRNETRHPTIGDVPPDNWIYIQEPDVKVGRLQIFNNWSPYLVADPDTVWVGCEYFANEGDELWERDDESLVALAVEELARIDVIDADDVLDGCVIRMPKAYPAYFGSYERVREVQEFTDTLENLFLVGRNGMHRYNNQDHSVLTAIEAVRNMREGRRDKSNIWKVNTEQEYHEESSSSPES